MGSKGKHSGKEREICDVCGTPLNQDGVCGNCSPVVGKSRKGERDIEARSGTLVQVHESSPLTLITQVEGVGEARAKTLIEHGFTSIESLRDSSVEELATIPGISEKLAFNIKEAAERILSERNAAQSEALSRWLAGEDENSTLADWLGIDVPHQKKAPALEDSNIEALRKWLSGGEEDAFHEWLGVEKERVEKPATKAEARSKLRNVERVLEQRERELKDRDREIKGMRSQIDALRNTLSSRLQEIKTGDFDLMKYIEETAELSKQLQIEMARRKEMEEEIEHIKKGSIAVIKYLKAQQLKSGASSDLRQRLQEEATERRKLEAEHRNTLKLLEDLKSRMEERFSSLPDAERQLKQIEARLLEKEAELRSKEEQLHEVEEAGRRGALSGEGAASDELQQRLQEELREKEQEFLTKENELKKRIIALEEEVNRYKIEEQLRQESKALEGKSKGEVQSILVRKEQQLLAKEKSILLREQEIERLREELLMKEEEMKKLKEPLAYKEEELLRREEDLLYREKLLQAERRKIDELRAQGISAEEGKLKDRLEQLKAEIVQKEEEVRTKEKYLKAKMEELRLREQGLVEEEIQAREEERVLEFKQEKVKTGISRLDDLLLGGIPFGSNVSIYGPAYVGKEIIVNIFMAEGLKKGIPIIWVITDKMPSDIREEMKFVLPSYEEYEKLGLVKYVDAYSRSMGSEEEEPNATYIQDSTDHEAILRSVDQLAKEIKTKHPYYRLAFRSISTLIAYMDPTVVFKFLQPFAGRRKRDKAVSMYILEKGMHEEQEIQTISSVMDGSVEFKVEQLKSFFSVRGVCDVQSRAWIRYTYSKQSVSIGSFSLDHIK